MTINTALTNLQQANAAVADVVEAARAQLATINTRIGVLEADRDRTVSAKPHADDIAAAMLRGLNNASDSYRRQLGAHLIAKYAGETGAASVRGASADFLTVGSMPSDREMLRARADGAEPDKPLSFDAVAYLLRDKIAAEIPALVDSLCPSSRTGMKGAARTLALQAIDAELTTLRQQRDELEAGLLAARKAVTR